MRTIASHFLVQILRPRPIMCMARRDAAGPQSSEIAAVYLVVISQLLTTAIVADDVIAKRVALANEVSIMLN